MTGSPSRDDGLTLERGRAHRRERAESPSRDRGVTLERSRSHPREIAESPSREDGRTVERGQAHRRERTGSPSREDRLTVERGQAHRRERTGSPSREDRLTHGDGRAHYRQEGRSLSIGERPVGATEPLRACRAPVMGEESRALSSRCRHSTRRSTNSHNRSGGTAEGRVKGSTTQFRAHLAFERNERPHGYHHEPSHGHR